MGVEQADRALWYWGRGEGEGREEGEEEGREGKGSANNNVYVMYIQCQVLFFA